MVKGGSLMTDFHYNLRCLIPDRLPHLGYELSDWWKTQHSLSLLFALRTPGLDHGLGSDGDGCDRPPEVGPSLFCKMLALRARRIPEAAEHATDGHHAVVLPIRPYYQCPYRSEIPHSLSSSADRARTWQV